MSDAVLVALIGSAATVAVNIGSIIVTAIFQEREERRSRLVDARKVYLNLGFPFQRALISGT